MSGGENISRASACSDSSPLSERGLPLDVLLDERVDVGAHARRTAWGPRILRHVRPKPVGTKVRQRHARHAQAMRPHESSPWRGPSRPDLVNKRRRRLELLHVVVHECPELHDVALRVGAVEVGDVAVRPLGPVN